LLIDRCIEFNHLTGEVSQQWSVCIVKEYGRNA